MPTVSVIIPSYNHENFISEAIKSVLNQTFHDFELIIIDDASTDDTVKRIKKIKDSRITLITSKKNRGQFVATNEAISLSKGKYISILNSDDVYHPTKLEKQVAFLEENPRYGAVFSYAHLIDENGDDFTDTEHFYYNIFKQPNRTRYEWLKYFFYSANALCHPSVLMRKSVHEKLGLYNELFAQVADLDMWVRICMREEIYVMPEELIEFRVREEQKNMSGTNPKNTTRFLWEYATILKHYLEIDKREELLRIFPELKKQHRGALDNKFIPFYIAELALKIDSPHKIHQFFALETLYEFLHHADFSEKAEKKYAFSPSNFTRLTGTFDLFKIKWLENLDPLKMTWVNDLRGLMEQINIDYKQNQNLKSHIDHVSRLIDMLTEELKNKNDQIIQSKKTIRKLEIETELLEVKLKQEEEEKTQRLEKLQYSNERMLEQIIGTKGEIDKLTDYLAKIKSSYLFKSWQAYCKIREAFIILLKGY